MIPASAGKARSPEQFLILPRAVLAWDKPRSQRTQGAQKKFICPFPRSSPNSYSTALRGSETCLPVFISCLHIFQLQALSAFRVPPQRDGADPGSHSAAELPAHRTEPLLHCQPRVKPPRITQVRLGFLTPFSWVWLLFGPWQMSLLSC